MSLKGKIAELWKQKLLTEKQKLVSIARNLNSSGTTFSGLVNNNANTITDSNGQVFNGIPLGNPSQRIDGAVKVNSTQAVYVDADLNSRRQNISIRPVFHILGTLTLPHPPVPFGSPSNGKTSNSPKARTRPVLLETDKGRTRVVPIPHVVSQTNGSTLAQLFEWGSASRYDLLDPLAVINNPTFRWRAALSPNGKNLVVAAITAMYIRTNDFPSKEEQGLRFKNGEAGTCEVLWFTLKNIGHSPEAPTEATGGANLRQISYEAVEVGTFLLDKGYRNLLGLNQEGAMSHVFGTRPPGAEEEEVPNPEFLDCFTTFDVCVDNEGVASLGWFMKRVQLNTAGRRVLMRAGQYNYGASPSPPSQPWPNNYYCCPTTFGNDRCWNLGGIGSGDLTVYGGCSDGYFKTTYTTTPSGGGSQPDELSNPACFSDILVPIGKVSNGGVEVTASDVELIGIVSYDDSLSSSGVSRTFTRFEYVLIPDLRISSQAFVAKPINHVYTITSPTYKSQTNPDPRENGCVQDIGIEYVRIGDLSQFVDGFDVSEFFSVEPYHDKDQQYPFSQNSVGMVTLTFRKNLQNNTKTFHFTSEIRNSTTANIGQNRFIFEEEYGVIAIRADADLQEGFTNISGARIQKTDVLSLQSGATRTIINARLLTDKEKVFRNGIGAYIADNKFVSLSELSVGTSTIKGKYKTFRALNSPFISDSFLPAESLQYTKPTSKTLSFPRVAPALVQVDGGELKYTYSGTTVTASFGALLSSAESTNTPHCLTNLCALRKGK